MSDNEGGKKSGYRVEYANSARSKCNGPKPCKGTAIGKGELRFGSLIDFRGNTTFSWRHWGCVTTKIITNMKNSFNDADELDGFEDLKDEDQERIQKAWEEGQVASEDVPETAKKGDGEDEDEDEEKPKKRGGKKKEEEDNGPGVFKLEYATSARSKCKACGVSIGKDFFRLGNEVDFRGNKSFQWRHWGCAEPKLVNKLKASYDEYSKVEGYDELKDGEKEKVKRAWEEGQIPEDDKGPGEAVDTGKKKAAPRKKKDEDGEEKPKRSRVKAKQNGDNEMDVDDDEEKPKRGRGAGKTDAPARAKAAPKKTAAKKKKDEESGEDFADELAAIEDEEDEGEEEEPEELSKKRKRAPASKGAGSSKPPSKRAKPASTKPSSSAKPPSKSKAKPASSRGKKKVEEPIDEEDEDDGDEE